MIESDIRDTAAEHHHGTHGTTAHGAHSGDINSDAADSAGAVNKHDHRDEEITEAKGKGDTMQNKIAPTLTALALACIIGLTQVNNARAITIKANIGGDGAAIQNTIGKIDIGIDADIIDADIIDADITKEEIAGKTNVNYIERINGDDIIGAQADTDIVIDYINV